MTRAGLGRAAARPPGRRCATRTRPTRSSRSAPPPWWTTAGSSSAATSRTPSYGLGLCAECGLVSALHATGGGRLVAFACVDGDGGPLLPCGRCRQLLWEHGGPELLVDTADGPVPMSELLPRAFGRDDLDRVDGAGP